MGVTINLSSGGKLSSLLSNNSMLKSTRDKLQRQAERDNKVAFFEAQKENLKNTEASDVEGIARKLELFHSYEDQISAVKQEYNSSQMFSALDEARERGEKLAEAAKKNKPKTEEERRKEALKEASGDEPGDGMLSEIMDSLDAIEEKQLEESADAAQNMDKLAEVDNVDADMAETGNVADAALNVTNNVNGNANVGTADLEYASGTDVKPDKYNYKSYVPFDVRV